VKTESVTRTKIKKDDSVIVVRGSRKDRGKIGKVIKIDLNKCRVTIEKVHIIKEYVRANPQKNIQGGIVDREGSVPMASVMYYCGECEQGVRIGYKLADDKSKQRICKKCNRVID